MQRAFFGMGLVCSLAFSAWTMSADSSLGQDAKKPDKAELFKKIDKDGDSKLSLAEFKGKKEGEKATKAEAQFKKLDKNSDGFLSLEEFVGPANTKTTSIDLIRDEIYTVG